MEKDIKLEKLNIRQTIKVYNKSLKHAFPANERRPLIHIIRGMIIGSYECIGAFDEGEIVGYAFFVKQDRDYLWDYFAVLEEYRCSGIGTKILQAIKEYYKTADSIIGEVENPALAGPDDDSEIMSRRLNFYLRNGCVDTGVRTETFGANFIIIMILDKNIDTSRVASLYESHYRKFVPRRIYDANIKVYN